MKKRIGPRRSHVFILAVLLSIACGGQSLIPGMPTFPPIPPQPGTSNVPTGSSPLSGDWNASPDFGRLAFTVDPDGKNVTTVVIGVSNWSCGGTTLTTELQVLNPWPISDGQFAGQANLNGNFHTMIVKGSYDSANKQFSGTWEEDAHGTICSGKWESVSRK
jgi:hypothetical protein